MQNTILTKVTVYYPFHPLHGLTLDVTEAPWRRVGLVTVAAPTGYRVKIPLWMVAPQAAGFELSGTPEVSPRALLSLAEILDPLLDRIGQDDTPSPAVSYPEDGTQVQKEEDTGGTAQSQGPARANRAGRRDRFGRKHDPGGGNFDGRSDHSGLSGRRNIRR